VRVVHGQSAGEILSGISSDIIYKFDQTCRVKAIELAHQPFTPNDGAKLSINFMPNTVYDPDACIRASLAVARRVGFDPGRLVFELSEDEQMRDVAHVGTSSTAIVSVASPPPLTTSVQAIPASDFWSI
jgi:hypothetical protein